MLYIYEVAALGVIDPFPLTSAVIVDAYPRCLDAVCCILYQQMFLPFLLSYPTANERL